MPSRTDILVDLIGLRRPLSEVAESLAEYPWDSEEELVRLTEENVADAMRRFLGGQLSSDEFQRWASLIEGREDIDYEGFSELIFCLATPEINEPIDRERAAKVIASLAAQEPGRS